MSKRQFNVRITPSTLTQFGGEVLRLSRIDKRLRRDPLAEAALKSFLDLPQAERERRAKEVA
jgi:hypothetical protein